MKRYVVGFALLLTSASVCDAQVRKWTDATGKYSVEAEFLDFKDGRVHLRKADGQVIPIPLEKLSAADQEHVRQKARQPAVGREKPRGPAPTTKSAGGEIGGQITVQGPRPEGWITVGCLGKNPDGRLESPAVGSKTDASHGGGTCLTWKPRNTTLRWDGNKASGTHQHVNRLPGRYLVYLRGRPDSDESDAHDEGYYDWKWVDVQGEGSAVVADLEIDPANLGTLEVVVKGPTKESSVVCLPLDDDGRLPLPGAHYQFSHTSDAKIEDGKAIIRGLREGKYQVAMGPWQRGARSPDGKTVLEMLPSVTADFEVKRGTTVTIQLTPEEPNAASTPKTGLKNETPAGSGVRSAEESAAGTMNLMATAKYSSSSEQEGVGCATANAFDGDASTRWDSQSGDSQGAWLAARWDQPVTIQKLIIREAHDRIADLTVQRLDGSENDWVDLLHVFGNRHLSSYSQKGGERGWGYRPDAVWVDDRRLGDSKGRTFGDDPDGSEHPVFTINLPDPLTTRGIRLFVKRTNAKSISIFELEAY